MMEDLDQVPGEVTLDAPIYEDSGFQCSNSFAPYQLSSYHAEVSMSWPTTCPSLLSGEQNWLLNSPKTPLSQQNASNYVHQQHNRPDSSTAVGQLDMMAVLNAELCDASMHEHSQWLQFYSLYQDQYGFSTPSFVPSTDTIAPRPDCSFTMASDCLQVVSSSGSDSLSTTETSWRSQTSRVCTPEYDMGFGNLSETSSISVVRDTRECNFLSPIQQYETMTQEVTMHPRQDTWKQSDVNVELGRSRLCTAPVLTLDLNLEDVLPSTSSTSEIPPLHRPRTWREALGHGAAEHDYLTNWEQDVPAGPAMSRPIRLREGNNRAQQQACLKGKLQSADYPVERWNMQDEGRLSIGRVSSTSVEPQSVAARHRRKKISEKIRVLEKLVPGGNKMDTATMLNEAIEYVKFLQLQVQILESDSFDDVQAPTANSTSTVGLAGKAGKVHVNTDRQGMKRKVDAGSAGNCSGALSLRAAGSPLVLSEAVQQQLFKKKLCLVSIRQCPPRSAMDQALAPSSLRRR